ncbi:MAG: putative membrane protein YfcA [Halovenus sp.]
MDVLLPASPLALAGVAGVLFVAGTVNGIAGFGFALVATMALATAVEPATAVVFVILPILAVNLTLAGELSGREVRTCGDRFLPLLASAALGVLVGMVALGALPDGPLRLVLGGVTLAFVASVQQRVTLPGGAALGGPDDRGAGLTASTPAMAAVGGVGGALFGGTNVGVQLVAYLRGFELSHDLFVGVVALLFLSLNTVRIVAAALLGLYPDPGVALLSAAAAVPAVGGVLVGSRLRGLLTPELRRGVVLLLLTVIAVQLLRTGLGV